MLTEKLVEITTEDKLILPGIFFEPKQKTKRAIILLHGNGTSSVFYSLAQYRKQAQSFATSGLAYLCFNNRGSGIYTKIKTIGGKKKVLGGTAFEKIKDCVKDIDGGINFLKKSGYADFSLLGFSTGANKICVYHYLKPKNQIRNNIIVCGADDMGLYYTEFGKNKFFKILKLCRAKIAQGKSEELMDPRSINNRCYSYGAMFDILNPEGLYNTFPFLDKTHTLNLSKKKLFKEIKSIKSPSLIIYGDHDEFSFGQVEKNLALLKNELEKKNNFDFKIIKDADHGFTGKEKQLNNLIIAFLKS